MYKRIAIILAGIVAGFVLVNGLAVPAQAAGCPDGCSYNWTVHSLGTSGQGSLITLTANPENNSYRPVSYCESRTTEYQVVGAWIQHLGVTDYATCFDGSVVTSAGIQLKENSAIDIFWTR